jgi:hypothetical protein
MFRHNISYLFFGVGIAALLFSLIRTYYLVWKMKKERDERGRRPRHFQGYEDKQDDFKR